MYEVCCSIDWIHDEGGLVTKFCSGFPCFFTHEAEGGIAREEAFGDEVFYLFVCFGDLQGMSDIRMGTQATCDHVGGHLCNRLLLTRSAVFFLSSKSLVDVFDRRDSDAVRIMTPASSARERSVAHIEGRSIEFQTHGFADCEDMWTRSFWSCKMLWL